MTKSIKPETRGPADELKEFLGSVKNAISGCTECSTNNFSQPCSIRDNRVSCNFNDVIIKPGMSAYGPLFHASLGTCRRQ
mmetsp:Transcript_37492/g.99814  ORF Transcript_37492/g.99814 Transcript_37492/m.99814 type:complete len:80 (-) Transcript_37492:509-748(-)